MGLGDGDRLIANPRAEMCAQARVAAVLPRVPVRHVSHLADHHVVTALTGVYLLSLRRQDTIFLRGGLTIETVDLGQFMALFVTTEG